MADKILLRGDTKANWESVNPILSAKEMVIETDTNRTKIGGDGVKTYTLLPGYRNGKNSTSMMISPDIMNIQKGNKDIDYVRWYFQMQKERS